MELRPILVTGAAGKTGLAVLRALRRRGAAARAMVRCAHHEETVRGAGAADVAHGDLRDPGALADAVEGVRAIYHICPNVSPHEVTIGRHLLEAASRAGVEHFVMHSVLHPQTEAMPHHWRKLRVEELVFESGLPFTILQPTAYMDNVLAYLPRVVSEGVYDPPYGMAARISMVDLADVAQAAALVLTQGGHLGATYELCAPEALDPAQVASILGAVLDRPVKNHPMSLSIWQEKARAGGLDDERVEILSAMFRYYDRHGLVGNPNVLRWLLGREPATLRQFAERSLLKR